MFEHQHRDNGHSSLPDSQRFSFLLQTVYRTGHLSRLGEHLSVAYLTDAIASSCSMRVQQRTVSHSLPAEAVTSLNAARRTN
eukprot:5546346-Pyramimonas_sp.AAC.1